MSQNIEVRFQLGNEAGSGFEDFWNMQLDEQNVPNELTATFKATETPKEGLAFSIPPEVVIEVSKAAAAVVVTGLGQIMWDSLRRYFSEQPPSSYPNAAVIIVGNKRIVFKPGEMDTKPPEKLVEAFQRHVEE